MYAIRSGFPRLLPVLAALVAAACATPPIDEARAPEVVWYPASEVAAGTFARSGSDVSTAQPDLAALDAVASAGFAAVIDLRGVDESRGMDEPAEVARRGMHYVALPVAGAADITYANARALDRSLSRFEAPLLLHCGSGNRVGALLALRARLQGASPEEALAAGRVAGLTGLEPVVRQRLSEAP